MRFAEEGAQVVVADIDLDAAMEVAEEIGGRAIRVDVAARDSVVMCMEEIGARYGRIDVLVNSAGVCILGTIVDLEEQEWDRQLDVNLKGVYLTAKYAWPLLKESANGAEDPSTLPAVVNIASTAGFWVVPGESAYTASKAGLIMLTKAMAVEGARDRVRVNCINPGPVETPMAAGVARSQGDADGTIDTYVRLCPLGRMGAPLDIANGALYLASSEAAWLTGVALVIDGGWTLGFWGSFPPFLQEAASYAGEHDGHSWGSPPR
jgi:NAD(P)-dependent dehydrogenase (short-subunit alcohol dehydrogenase family)